MKRYEHKFGKNPAGALSTTSGYATETTNFGETAFGILNKSTRDENNFTTPEVVSSSTATLFSVGNGTDTENRKNIIELKADGTVFISGVGGYDGTNPEDSTNVSSEFQNIHEDIEGLGEDIDRIDNTIESIHVEQESDLVYTFLVDGENRGTINIPRDQFLKDVNYNAETNDLEFLFLLRDENNDPVEKPVKINMTDLEDIYTNGDGLNLENKQFSIKIDADTQPYIDVTSNGLKIIGVNEKFGEVNEQFDQYKEQNDNRVTAIEEDIVAHKQSNDTKFAELDSKNTEQDGRLEAVESDLSDLIGDGEGSVQDQINNALEDYLPLSGGTMTGNITFGSDSEDYAGGIIISGKSDTDLVNAVGSTTTIDNIREGLATEDALNEYKTSNDEKIQSIEDKLAQEIEAGNTDKETIDNYTVNGHKISENPTLTKTDVGLDQVDNVQQIPATEKGAANGVVPLNADGKIDSVYLDGQQSPVQGVDGTYTFSTLPESPTEGMFIYVSDERIFREYDGSGWESVDPKQDTLYNFRNNPPSGDSSRVNILYRWDGAQLAEVSSTISIGEVTGTAYEGNKGAANRAALDSLPGYLVYGVTKGPVTDKDINIHVNVVTKYGLNYGSISPANFTLEAATSTAAGVMSAQDKSNLDTLWGETRSAVGSNIYTGANYISKETNLTEAVLQLDEEIKATNDNLSLEHENAEATYAKKTDLNDYLPLTGGTLTGLLYTYNAINITPQDYSDIPKGFITFEKGGYKYPSLTLGFGNNCSDLTNYPYGKSSNDIIHVGSSVNNSTLKYRVSNYSGSYSTNLIHLGDPEDNRLPRMMYGWNNSNRDKKYPTFQGLALLTYGKSTEEYIPDMDLTDYYTIYDPDGVTIPNKTNQDLLHAAGGTVSIQDIIAQANVPTNVSQLTNDAGYQTEAQVSAKVSALVNSAPETLDTLKELADALNNDPNFATTISAELGKKLNTDTYNTDKDTFALKSEALELFFTGNDVGVQDGSGSNTLEIWKDGTIQFRRSGNLEAFVVFALKSDLDTYLTKTDASNTYQPKGNYLTSVPSEYVTDTELNAKGYVTKATADSTYQAKGNYLTSVSWDQVGSKPSWIGSSKPSYTWDEIGSKPLLATVATSGSYNDLTNKPAIPSAVTVDSALSSTSTNPVQNKVINSALAGKANSSHTHTASQVSGLATVATSGSYNDLSNKPSIPQPTVSAASGSLTLWTGTETEYNAIATKDPNTLYFILES